jgi:zeaxanthin glucosyltransferase
MIFALIFILSSVPNLFFMPRSKLILLILDGKSALNGSFSLSRALVEQGHKVVYITTRLEDRQYVESQGFPYLILPLDDFNPSLPSPNDIKNPIKKHLVKVRHVHAALDYIYMLAEKWINEVKPDIVLLDSILPRFAPPFLKKNIPIININCTLSTIDHAGRPPIFSGLVPARRSNPLSNLRIRIAWAKIYLHEHYKELKIKLDMLLALGPGAKWIGSMVTKYGAKTKRTEYGIRLIGPEIFMGSKHIDFPATRDPGSQVKWYMGACVEKNRVQEYFNFNFLDKEKKLIYCAMGTHTSQYKFQKNLYRCLFEAMEQLTGCQLILQSQGVGDFTQYKQIPENVMIVPKAPQLKLLEMASLFITHGGSGSIREGAYYGVPMIVFPGWHDQPGNAARVIYHNLGAKGDMRTITTKRLLSLIGKVMNKPEIRNGAQKMSEKLREDDNRPAIVQFIESYSS